MSPLPPSNIAVAVRCKVVVLAFDLSLNPFVSTDSTPTCFNFVPKILPILLIKVRVIKLKPFEIAVGH